ncbi:hypothetical protein PoB_006821800 [Plakobranchus ocellatus]|uniref:Uncharacterized protein n=1 Tax=Plakobranchus ocellatus TaxID=259542 RepID=A0AAV4DBT1_9GAST|nr:hypothetical protein PoB_006821800 [Plakobranchus ocellatus]
MQPQKGGKQSDSAARFQWRRPPDVSSADLHQFCSARFQSPMNDFPEFLRVKSQIRVTTYVPANVELEVIDESCPKIGKLLFSELILIAR